MIENILTIFTANFLVLVIPGINFYLISNISMNKGIKFGTISALGVTTGIMIHVVLSIFGSYAFFNEYPQIFKYIKIAGVIYIIFLAFKLLNLKQRLKSFLNHSKCSLDSNYPLKNYQNDSKLCNSLFACFAHSFFIDLLNPYVSCFYFALFTQVIDSRATKTSLAIYICFIFVLTFSWFFIIALLFSRIFMKIIFIKYRQAIECVCAIFLLYFAVRLYCSPM